jgi:hypothetical protein
MTIVRGGSGCSTWKAIQTAVAAANIATNAI